MDLDLNTLLDGWPHEPGKIKVRRISGRDGRDKIQLRLDLGMIQMEADGRPDGNRPHNCDSLLAWHQQRAEEAESGGGTYELSADDCAELQQEGVQYYHRYISLFQLEDYDSVIRDTQRNLALFDFVREHCDRDELIWSFQQFRPYVLMMLARAKANRSLEIEDYEAAIREVRRTITAIEKVFADSPNPEQAASSPELTFMTDWLEELLEKRPVSRREQLERELEEAISVEAYEKAAELRDEIRELNSH